MVSLLLTCETRARAVDALIHAVDVYAITRHRAVVANQSGVARSVVT